MKIELIPSTVGTAAARQFCHAAIINETVAIDAGTLGLLWPIERQSQIEHVFLSHSHIDHIATLALFLDNVYRPGPTCPIIHAGSATANCLREDIFNDRVWPDFLRLSQEESPLLELLLLESETAVGLTGLTITPISINHPVPTLGFLVEDESATVMFASDTGPTERIWESFAAAKNPRAAFVETSFPNSHRWLADKAGHLCPELLHTELEKAPPSIDTMVCHLKAAFFDEIVEELNALDHPNLQIAVPGYVYEF